MVNFNKLALSCYLAFRYLPESDIVWSDRICPRLPTMSTDSQVEVCNSAEIFSALKQNVEEACSKCNTGILLSGGIDSAILAAFMPAGSQTYTIKFEHEGAIDESILAAEFSQKYKHHHNIITVSWSDYLENMDCLMTTKKSPLHAVEIPLYLASLKAHSDGIEKLIVGNGADSTFGGLDKLLSKDWTFNAFMRRYTFINPATILNSPSSVKCFYDAYKIDEGIDINSFLKNFHGAGIIQAFNNSIKAANVQIAEPYEMLKLGIDLDLSRIRNGESKYMLRKIFAKLYPEIKIPDKIAFARPMDVWLADSSPPQRREFLRDIDMQSFSGDQKWLLFCLEHFLNLFDD